MQRSKFGRSTWAHTSIPSQQGRSRIPDSESDCSYSENENLDNSSEYKLSIKGNSSHLAASKVLFAALALFVFAEADLIPIAHHAPQPYKFGYSVKDKHGEQHREEVGDGHSGVKGSYGFTDDRGVQRQVNYVADHAGFRAQVKTNEPGTANQDPAAVNIISSAHPYYGAGYGLGGVGLGGVGLGYAGYGAAGLGVAGLGAPAAFGYGVPVAGLGLGLGRGIGLGYGSVTGYDSRYGAY